MRITEELEILTSGISEIKPGGHEALQHLLNKSKKENRPLRVKLGIDPTSSDLHLGHMVCIQKLKQFQDLGHTPVLIIGGYTAQVGDPSGRNEARPPLSKESVAEHAQTYIDQVSRVLDLNKTEIVNNADWFDNFSMTDMIKLASTVTVNQLIAKDAFGKRIENAQPLYLHETYYPLLQGFDSYQIRSDIELGGTDQIFNLMVGRDIQKLYGMEPQLTICMPLLIGLDGSKKMSKTSNNYIALTDTAQDMFGKTMSIPDELILDYFTLAGRATLQETQILSKRLADGENPRHIKDELGQRIVSIYYSEQEAKLASENFTKLFKQKEIPEDIAEYQIQNGPKTLVEILVESGLCPSKGEAKRLIAGGGVKLNGNKLEDPLMPIEVAENQILQAGKRKFIKLINAN